MALTHAPSDAAPIVYNEWTGIEATLTPESVHIIGNREGILTATVSGHVVDEYGDEYAGSTTFTPESEGIPEWVAAALDAETAARS